MGNNEGSISVPDVSWFISPIRYKMNYNSSFNAPYLLSRRRNSTYKKRIVVLPPWRSDFSVVADDKSKTGRSGLSLILRSFFPVSTCVSLVSYVVCVFRMGVACCPVN
ncbi:hypothetical protein F2Q70_00008087 [Brassica cretica]|uniref:Uncharacterized protein n=1 Tax=Brassica cretica TaxID=69181 RepID=A0A8S9M3Y9_BRACR|nr:hypothetical protein F2Q70_00008087 [Brassica cretica]